MMATLTGVTGNTAVASFAEAWIEIMECLKHFRELQVASFAEAWIEIMFMSASPVMISVASFAEAWIEISTSGRTVYVADWSPPSRRRGLKLFQKGRIGMDYYGRLLRGGVD